MCGIAGYVGGGNAPEVLFDMLKRLEYRGYDSAGIAYFSNGRIQVPKDIGKVDEVRAKLKLETLKSGTGIGHTRWATHGVPSKANSHPHPDCSGDFVVAHNGIIENYKELKKELVGRGHKFRSETDTEVVAHFIEEYCKKDVISNLPRVLRKLKGSYALVILSKNEPDRIFFARHDSPLLIGIGDGENFIASDAPAFLGRTRRAVILEDHEYGFITSKSQTFYNPKKSRPITKKISEIDWDCKEAEKGGYEHFMLKEINEEPQAASNAIRDYDNIVALADKLADCRRIYLVGCGTAYHACLFGKYVLESFGLSAEACLASEFRYSTIGTIGDDCGVVAVSQSGETADTLAAMKQAKRRGAYVASIVNVVGSSITRMSDRVAYINAGPEISVASTKAYIGQLVTVAAVCIEYGHKKKKIGKKEYKALKDELRGIGASIKEVILGKGIRGLAELEADTRTFFFVGRRENHPTALEGALKLKEISYRHTEGYAAGELKHGPLAIMDETVTVIAVLPSDELREKVESNIMEIKARKAKVITVGVGCDIKTPKTSRIFAPIVNIAPLHLFAYYISVLRGIDPDKPRNLAKSVTVE